MKLIYVADVHGAFERVRELLDLTDADIYIIAGDLVDIPFYTAPAAVSYHGLQTYFHGIKRGRGKGALTLEDFVDELLEDPGLSGEMLAKGIRYRQETLRARKVFRQNCRLLESVFSLKPRSRIFCLPGNHDMDLQHTALCDRDLHLRSHTAGPLRIAGYGSAAGSTPGVPERYSIMFHAGIGISDERNEMCRFFKSVQPHIIATHQPAYGIHDFLAPIGETGSLALRSYCERHPVLLCLTGHLHDQWGLEEANGTVFLNPSHFGEVGRSDGRMAEGGFFYEVAVEEKGISRIRHKKLTDGKIYDIVAHERKQDHWEQVVVDRARFSALLGGRNYETQRDDYSRDHERSLAQEIRRFYGIFQPINGETPMTTGEAAAGLPETGLEAAFAADVIARSADGTAKGRGSDNGLEMVLYLRCGLGSKKSCTSDHIKTCTLCRMAGTRLNMILGGKQAFKIVDCIDLNRVENSIQERNYECEPTQRFIAYRSIGRPVNRAFLAPVEDLLNADRAFRGEMEGSLRSYFSIFLTTARHVASFKKLESRLNAMGMTVPEPIGNRFRLP